MPSVFDTSRCSLSSIPALPSVGTFTFIADCSVPDAPPPIYDCPDLDFEIPNLGPVGALGPAGAPGIDAPCTNVSISIAATNFTYARTVNNPKFTFQITKLQPSSSISLTSFVCQTDFAARMSLSLPCPDFTVSGSLTTLAFGNSSATLEVTREDKYPETDQCGEIVKFKFNLPKTATWRSGVGPPLTGLGTDGDFYLDLGDGTALDIGNGDVYRKINGNWGTPITNIKGQDGSSGLMPCCPMTTYASIVTGVYCQGNQLLVQYQS
jgi:hypothetical protein